MKKWGVAVAAACWALAAPLGAAEAAGGVRRARPTAIAFDFESSFDRGEWGRKVGEVFRGHLFRRGSYQTIDNVSFDEAVQTLGFAVKHDTPPERIARALREVFSADLAIWGEVRRPRAEVYELRVRAVRLEGEGHALVLDETRTCAGRHDIPSQVDRILDQLEGEEPEAPVDLLASEDWKKRPNLVKNGGFEQGRGTPDFWEPVDGLSTFWVEGKSPTGKCVLLDTDVDWDQYEAWRKAFADGRGKPASEAPAPLRGTHYKSIGGTVGAHLYSDWIPIEQGATYRFDCDFLGPATNSKVFIKGYAEFKGEFGFEAQRREVYRAPVWMRNEDSPNRWKHFARVFHPTQPMALLGFDSDYDEGRSGAALKAHVLKALQEKHDLVLAAPDLGERAVRKAGLKLAPDVRRDEIALLMRETYGRGTAVWGRLTRTDAGEVKLDLLGLDVRKETTTKFFHDEWPFGRAPDLAAAGERVAARIVELVRPVRWLRVKLDAYWPPGQYCFDNISITREPMPEE